MMLKTCLIGIVFFIFAGCSQQNRHLFDRPLNPGFTSERLPSGEVKMTMSEDFLAENQFERSAVFAALRRYYKANFKVTNGFGSTPFQSAERAMSNNCRKIFLQFDYPNQRNHNKIILIINKTVLGYSATWQPLIIGNRTITAPDEEVTRYEYKNSSSL